MTNTRKEFEAKVASLVLLRSWSSSLEITSTFPTAWSKIHHSQANLSGKRMQLFSNYNHLIHSTMY
uniref:Uncharacterized protein n=1 Tax=Arundo donax TaxID=35708 RepID=A0A0A9FYR4_ARUDO